MAFEIAGLSFEEPVAGSLKYDLTTSTVSFVVGDAKPPYHIGLKRLTFPQVRHLQILAPSRTYPWSEVTELGEQSIGPTKFSGLARVESIDLPDLK